MVCNITHDGVIIIKAENELESYALSKYMLDNDDDLKCDNLIIDWGIEE